MIPLLDLPTAAAMLGISPCTLRRYAAQGKVAYVRVGGIKFTEQDLEEYVERSRVDVRSVSVSQIMHKPLKRVRVG